MIHVFTDHPLAADSVDHRHPRGTMNDSSVNPAFNRKLFVLVKEPSVLDLGCAGGGFVASVIEDGGFAAGIEGSSYSLVRQRAAWRDYGEVLHTADITRPFVVVGLEDMDAEPFVAEFDIITAWEVMEHIAATDVPQVLENVRRHLSEHGLFIVSITTVSDFVDGHEYHATIQPEAEWDAMVGYSGFWRDPEAESYFAPDWVRSGPHTFNAVYRREG